MQPVINYRKIALWLGFSVLSRAAASSTQPIILIVTPIILGLTCVRAEMIWSHLTVSRNRLYVACDASRNALD